MEHIRRYDWCNFPKNDNYFLDAESLHNSATERILRGKFSDPLHSSEDERSNDINWSELKKNFIKSKTGLKNKLVYIPGLKPVPRYKKLSALQPHQHYNILKVIAARNPDVTLCPLPEPTENDIKLMEELKETIENEMKEFVDWAKSMWISNHIVRALRPNEIVECVYDALFNEVKSRILSIPKQYEMAAQISLESVENKFEFSHEKDLIKVNISQLPMMGKLKYCIKKFKSSLPQACPKHPCHFVLPNEKSKTYLPFQDVQPELAEFAAEHDCEFIFNESAIRCIMEVDQAWMLPVNVKAVDKCGKKSIIYVISSQVFSKKQPSRARVYTAFKYLLKMNTVQYNNCSNAEINTTSSDTDKRKTKKRNTPNIEQMENSDEDEVDNLVIDLGESDNKEKKRKELNNIRAANDTKSNDDTINKSGGNNTTVKSLSTQNIVCTCKGTVFEKPPSRSFKKWKITNVIKKQSFNIIVHCSHKCRSANEEVVLEPIPEYQLDLGACKQSEHKRRSMAMSLFLRQKANLINVRIDTSNCDVIREHRLGLSDIREYDGRDLVEDGTNMLHTLCSQLHGLIPGEYILRHEPKHGKNALMYVARSHIKSEDFLNLDVAEVNLTDLDEKVYLETPPTLDDSLLPYHKHRKILPLMFTPIPAKVMKQPKPNPSVLANKIQKSKKKKRRKRKKVFNDEESLWVS